MNQQTRADLTNLRSCLFRFSCTFKVSQDLYDRLARWAVEINEALDNNLDDEHATALAVEGWKRLREERSNIKGIAS